MGASPMVQWSVPMYQPRARPQAAEVRETLKARVQMHNLRVILLRQNAQMMIEMCR